MNTLNFLQRLNPWLVERARAKRTDEDNLAILQAINAGAGQWANATDAEVRMLPGSAMVQPSATVAISVAMGLDAVTGSLTDGHRGQYALIPGDNSLNSVVSPTRLALPYVGSTTGAVTAVVFRNGVVLPDNWVAMQKVTVHAQTGKRDLTPAAAIDETTAQVTGDPLYYTLAPLGGNSGKTVLHVWPQPASAMAVSYTAEFRPKRWIMTDFQQARELEFGDLWEELIPYVLLQLLSTKLLKDGTTRAGIESTLAMGAGVQPKSTTGGSVYIGTPGNW